MHTWKENIETNWQVTNKRRELWHNVIISPWNHGHLSKTRCTFYMCSQINLLNHACGNLLCKLGQSWGIQQKIILIVNKPDGLHNTDDTMYFPLRLLYFRDKYRSRFRKMKMKMSMNTNLDWGNLKRQTMENGIPFSNDPVYTRTSLCMLLSVTLKDLLRLQLHYTANFVWC